MIELFRISIFVFTLLIFSISCNEYKCDCVANDDLITKDDSLISKSKDWKIWENIAKVPLSESKIDAFRLMISPSWSEMEKKLYTLTKVNDSIILSIEYFNSTWNDVLYDSLNRHETYEITNKQWSNFVNLVNKNCFWTIPCAPVKETTDDVLWILEGNTSKKNGCTKRNYHWVGRKHSKSEYHKYFELCNNLIDMVKK